MAVWKMAPALAAGCSVIIKPAEDTPLTAIRVAQIGKEAGIPDGVLNVLPGYGDVGEALGRHKDIDAVSFTGSTDFALNLVPLNAFFSASGIITFKKSTELQETFKKIPEDKLLIETDSPFLSPEPNRGKKNEPSFIKFTAQKLANLRNIEVDKLILLTTNNFNNLFSK